MAKRTTPQIVRAGCSLIRSSLHWSVSVEVTYIMAKRNGLKAAVGMSERYHKTKPETPCSEGKKPGRCLLDPRTTAGLTLGLPSLIGKKPGEFTTEQPSYAA